MNQMTREWTCWVGSAGVTIATLNFFSPCGEKALVAFGIAVWVLATIVYVLSD